MPRHQTWMIALVAPVLICLSLLFTCQYVSARASVSTDYKHKETPPLSLSLNAKSENFGQHIRASSLITFSYDARLEEDIFPLEVVYPNGKIVYSLYVSHDHTDEVSGLILTSTVSAEFIPEDSFDVGGSVTELSGYPNYAWQIDNLKPGKRAAIYIVGYMNPAQSAAGIMTNTAALRTDIGTDSDPTNNRLLNSLRIVVPQIKIDTPVLNVHEGEDPATIDIGLNAPNPFGDAQVDYTTVSLDDPSEAVSGQDYVPVSGTITISAANSSQRFFVDILDDEIDEYVERVAIKLTNPRGMDLGSSDMLTITIVDNDEANVLVDPQQLNVAENGQTERYTFTLTSEPTADVNINIDGDDSLAVDNRVITFTADNWKRPQAAWIGAVPNDVDDGDRSGTIRHQVSSQDVHYDNRTVNDIAVTIADDDSAGITISSQTITISEEDGMAQNGATYTIVLTSMPTASVFISVANADGQLRTDADTLTFTPQNWFVPQTLTILAADDALAEGLHTSRIAHSVRSADANYARADVADISINIEDNDEAGVLFSTTVVTTTETIYAGVYTVTLTSQPSHPVLIQTKTENAGLIIQPKTLEFSPETWNVAQQITVSASTDNSVNETQTTSIEHLLTSDDPLYSERAESLVVNVQNVDRAGLEITSDMLTSNTLIIIEGQTSSSTPSGTAANQYDVRLTSRPTSAVTVTLQYSEQITVVPGVLIFEPASWQKPQSVGISTDNDSTFKGRRAFTIDHQLVSGDLNYDRLTDRIEIQIEDDDPPVEMVTKSEGLIAGTSSDDYRITLIEQPTDAVTITLTTTDQLVVNPSMVRFTGDDWNMPQTIIVTSTDDLQDDQIGVIRYKILSEDIRYAQDDEINLVEIQIMNNDRNGVQNGTVYLPVVDR